MKKSEEKLLIKELERVLEDVKEGHFSPCFKVCKSGVITELTTIIEMLNEFEEK